jgi:CRP-like cAMP-binding protein
MTQPDFFNYSHPEQAAPGVDAEVILRTLDAGEWNLFQGFAEPLLYAPGECILRAGETGRAIYIIRAGHVRAELPLRKKAAPAPPMGPGAVFGELAFFDAGARSATLWAVDPVELLVLSFAAFERLAAWHPRIARELLLDLGRVISLRLRRAEAQGQIA